MDEANFIKRDALHAIIGFLAQTSSKIMFISSSNTGNLDTSFLNRIKKTPSEILNVVSYVCEEHLYNFGERRDAIACPCYRLHKPTFISLDAKIKKTANAFLRDSFNDEILGTSKSSFAHDGIIVESSQNEFDMIRYSTVNEAFQQHLDHTLYVYVDPAYTANKNASGTGIAAVGRYKQQFIIYGLEHFFLQNLLDESEQSIAECTSFMIRGIIAIHSFFERIKIIIEGNVNQASAVKIACYIKSLLCQNRVDILFCQTKDQNGIDQPFYLLQRHKRVAVEFFIAKFNSGLIKASQEIISHTIKINFDPIDYLLIQIRNIRRIVESDNTFFLIKKKTTSDDLIIALIMALFFCAEREVCTFSNL